MYYKILFIRETPQPNSKLVEAFRRCTEAEGEADGLRAHGGSPFEALGYPAPEAPGGCFSQTSQNPLEYTLSS